MRHALILIALSAAVVVAAPPGVPTAPKPEDVGVSTARLQRIHETVTRHIEAKDVSGAVTLVARRGKIVHFEAQGLADIDGKKPMAKDTIFRLASMSKPITSVAVMMMVEEGKVHLNDRVSTFIPEFKTMKVAVAKGTTDRPGSRREARATRWRTTSRSSRRRRSTSSRAPSGATAASMASTSSRASSRSRPACRTTSSSSNGCSRRSG